MKNPFSPILLITGILFLIVVSCKKEDTSNDPVHPPDTDTTGPRQFETPFTGVPSTGDIVMYEINERAFTKQGTLAGILPRLDSIKALGVNVIWLMPVFPIGIINTVNSPYCIRNYKEVNPEFGDLGDLRTLVRESHKRNMAVILDWVANHTSWDNPWINNKSWYTQDGNGNIIHPAGTNWQDVADLNFDNATMRLEMIKALKYWVLEANIDGYRCDAADFVPYDFWKQAIDTLRAIPGRELIMLAEGARVDHFNAGFQMNFGWSFYSRIKSVFGNHQSAYNLYQDHLDEYSAIPSGKHKLRFTSNHDECAWDDTPINLLGGVRASMSAFIITAYMGGVPLIYNGQEVGCNVKLSFFSKTPIDWSTYPELMAEYKFLMSFRKVHPALSNGTLSSFGNSDVVAFSRMSGTDEVLVVANTRNSAKTFTLPAALKNSSWKTAQGGVGILLGNELILDAYEYLILYR